MATSKKFYVDLDNLKFRKKDALGAGFFGEVYRVTDGISYDNRFVVKRFYTPKPLAFLNELGYGVNFEKETNALAYLGPKDISPKLFFKKTTLTSRYYVMEAMDTTLQDILKKDKFTIDYLDKLNKLLKRLFKTKYRHGDLHVNNIMWSEFLNDFRIVDWGMYDIEKKNNALSGIKHMIRSGDMFSLVQLYIAYKLETDEYSYWQKSFEEFLKLIPDSEILSNQLSEKEMKQRVKLAIKNHLDLSASNKPRRSKIKSKKKNSSKLTLREAQILLGENTNKSFLEMQNLSSRRKVASNSKKLSKSSRRPSKSSFNHLYRTASLSETDNSSTIKTSYPSLND